MVVFLSSEAPGRRLGRSYAEDRQHRAAGTFGFRDADHALIEDARRLEWGGSAEVLLPYRAPQAGGRLLQECSRR
jgi:hypothetical protein